MEEKETKQLFKNRLLDLIKKDTSPKVVAIKGEWGSGKSTFWRNLVKDEIGNQAYISLYGLNSIRDIENSILLQISDRKIFAEFVKKHLEPLNELKISGISAKSILSIIEPKDFANIVICLDDFERLSEKISVNELFGFISDLKENKKCKVVMILNEEKISQENKENFDIQKEKVIDYELFFKTSISDIKNNIIKNTNPIYENFLFEFIEKSEVQNIRTINKIINLLDDFISKLDDESLDSIIMKNIFIKIIEISFVYYQFNFKDFVRYKEYKNKQRDYLISKILKEQNRQKEDKQTISKNKKFLEENKELIIYDKYLKNYNFEDLEKNILSFITEDKFNKVFFTDFIKKEKYNLEHSDLRSQINSIIDNYRFDFNYTLEQYDEHLYKFLSENREKILELRNFEIIKKEIEKCKTTSINNYDELLIDMQKAYLKDYKFINYHENLDHDTNYQQIREENNSEVMNYLESLIEYNKNPASKDIIKIFEEINTQRIIPIKDENTVNKLSKEKIKEFILKDKEFVKILFDDYDKYNKFPEFKQKLTDIFEELKKDDNCKSKINNLEKLDLR
ncbi:P-loop NTPase fold protein [Aliarcobacter butzleri]|uniref:P-loop NTPase fold protein n=1 Tax=Aliarcobacter butzleri TaxID=28197 RepID=UPI001EDB96E4|nr:P-loop NTPase fold protein [Aliarcobacter butzleri]MCG3678780.1 hypothetical protein [Aliarcobacter butzleri]MCG3692615.1 hypothetical protein [Aliarcobacter butzleri]